MSAGKSGAAPRSIITAARRAAAGFAGVVLVCRPMARTEKSAPRQSVRIIAGTWRGTRIPIVPGTRVRPTPDRVRETVFNWLSSSIAGARCLDLYAGTGAFGIESLSRGAREAVFVERDSRLVAALREVLRRLGGQGEAVAADAARWLENRSVADTPATSGTGARAAFDIVFLDPPYDVPIGPLLAALPPWLAPGALVYVERPDSEGLPPAPEPARWRRESRAGQVRYGLIEYPPAAR
jgi:16S rRNA (guanine966-N2)-methyltransferase